MNLNRTMTLFCKLTKEEHYQRSMDLAKQLDLQDQIEERQAGEKKRMKQELDGVSSAIRQLSKVVREGVERREVTVVDEKDFKRGLAIVRRIDTGEVVMQRALDADERQTRIDEPKEEDEA